MEVPTPTLCPQERAKRRLSFRNERGLYHRTCAGTGKKIISIYAPEYKFPVYDNDFWWGDSWDAHIYGRDFDFSRPFFEQFNELLNVAPKQALIRQAENINSQFCNCASRNKDCYLLFSANKNEGCLYGKWVNFSRDCLDNFFILESELCYESISCINCYDLRFSQNCKNCTESWFLKNCVGCTNCFGCLNLHNKQYYFLNEKCTREEYMEKLRNLDLHKHSNIEKMHAQFIEFCKKFPHKYLEGVQNENVTGDYISNSKNTKECFFVNNLEDCAYCIGALNLKDCYDVSHYGALGCNELLYEGEGVGHGVQRVRFSKLISEGSSDIDYSWECASSRYLFGCAEMRNAEYCIFNKQYSKEEYFKLREKIIEHMKKTGEWGEFFPHELNPFCYNETSAQDYFPMTKEEILSRGWRWKEDNSKTKYEGPVYEIPDSIYDVPDEICKKILTCEATKKNYRIEKFELEFYRKMGLPIPRFCPNERHRKRFLIVNPRQLWMRKCDKCDIEIQSTFAPERPEKVFCEKCYLDAIN
jgi:hypothetical protein